MTEGKTRTLLENQGSGNGVPVEASDGFADGIRSGKGTTSKVPVPEVGGPSGPEPTRYGDWERKGRCYDF